MIKNNIAWIDIDHNEYSMDELTDTHLINIIRYLKRGETGHEWFVTNEVILNLREEAYRRGLKV